LADELPVVHAPEDRRLRDCGSGVRLVNREKEVLLGQLDSQRRHVLGILEGLSDEQLRRPVMPSGWNCLGLVQHLALSDEHYWFRCVVAGEPLDFFPEGPNADWQVDSGKSAEDVFDLYRNEIARSDAIITTTSLDAAPKQPDERWAEWGMDFPDQRSVIMHVISETAVHAGHLDATRELIDGRQWIVL
jgi:uncharacterized damage-inducible protein DinB